MNRLYKCDKCGLGWVSSSNICLCGHAQPLAMVMTNEQAQKKVIGQTVKQIALSTDYQWDGCFTEIIFESGDVAIMNGHCDLAIIDSFYLKEGYNISVGDE